MRNVLTIAVAALGVATATAQSQDPDALIPVNISLRLGVGLPLDNDLRDVSSSFLAFGVEYRPNRSLLRGGETFFAADLFKGDKSDTGYIVPVTLNQRFFTRTIADGRRTYAFVGLGAAFVKGSDNWDTTIAARGGLGAELGERIFMEGSLTLTDKSSKAGFNGNLIGLYIGYRF